MYQLNMIIDSIVKSKYKHIKYLITSYEKYIIIKHVLTMHTIYIDEKKLFKFCNVRITNHKKRTSQYLKFQNQI